MAVSATVTRTKQKTERTTAPQVNLVAEPAAALEGRGFIVHCIRTKITTQVVCISTGKPSAPQPGSGTFQISAKATDETVTEAGTLPTRTELHPSRRLRLSKRFVNSLIIIFVLLTISLVWWGIKGSATKHISSLALVTMVWFASVLMVVFILIVHMWREAHLHRVVEDDVEINALPHSFDGSVILYISDLHKRRLREEHIKPLLGQVDWVLIGGDVAEKGISWSIVRRNMQLLTNIAPAYAVYGNHDKHAGTAQLARILRKPGFGFCRIRLCFFKRGIPVLSWLERIIGLVNLAIT